MTHGLIQISIYLTTGKYNHKENNLGDYIRNGTINVITYDLAAGFLS